MLIFNKRRFKKQYVIGGRGIFEPMLKFLTRTFTNQAVKQVASSAAKQIGKTTLDAGKTVAVETGKKLIDKVINSKPKTSKKIDNIISKYTDNDYTAKRLNGSGQSKYTGNSNAVTIQDLVKRHKGSGQSKPKTSKKRQYHIEVY